jgi:hypothetical protein
MKLRLFILALASSLALRAADAVPIFNATLAMGRETRFILLSPAGKSSSWLKVGDDFEGYTLKAYDAKATALDLEREGKITRIKLASDASVANAPAAPTPGTLADAEDVLRKMKFGDMMKKMAAQQSKAMEPMLRQAAGQMKGVDPEKYIAFQKKMMDELLWVMAGPETQAAMAQAYSEVFSKDELAGLANFYGTPTGEALIDKQPEVSAKLNAFLMPRMMEMMPKMKQMQQDFMTEAKAGQAAAPASGAPASGKP